MTADPTITRAYGKGVIAHAKTHAPQKIHALLIQGNWISTWCNSSLAGLPDYGLSKASVTCPRCIKGMAGNIKYPWQEVYTENAR